mgnify:CR=1 FL=1
MAASPDGTTKFYFEHYRYWIINIHRQKLPECEEITIVDSSLSDKERISKLEELVKSMSAQIYYMQNRQERSECSMMELEHKETYHHLVNIELREQLKEKDSEKQRYEDKHQDETEKLRQENESLRCRLVLNSINMVRKDIQIEDNKEHQYTGEFNPISNLKRYYGLGAEIENMFSNLRKKVVYDCILNNQIEELSKLAGISINPSQIELFNEYRNLVAEIPEDER